MNAKQPARAGICVAVLCLAVGGCVGNFFMRQPWELQRVKDTDPAADFMRLRGVFARWGGNLTAADDDIVRWKDTQTFRLYEFKHHSVAVFPHNWNANCLDMYLINGHVRKLEHSDDLMFGYRYSMERGGCEINVNFNLTTNLTAVDKIGLQEIFLGMTAEEARAVERAGGPSKWGYPPNIYHDSHYCQYSKTFLENGVGYEFAGGGSVGNDIGQFDLTYLGQRLQWIHFYREGLRGGRYRSLQPLLISDFPGPVSVLAQGEFRISDLNLTNVVPGSAAGRRK